MQRFQLRTFSILFLSALFLLPGCATKQAIMPTTGFLSDYSNFELVEDQKGLYIKRYSGADVNRYKQILISPVTLYFDHESVEIEDEKLREMKKSLQDGLVTALKGKYDIVTRPGPGVLLIKTALTEVKANKVMLNLHWSTTLAGFGIGGATIEAEFIDSYTKKKVLAVITSQKGKRMKYFKGLSKWGHTGGVVEGWGEFLIDCLEQL